MQNQDISSWWPSYDLNTSTKMKRFYHTMFFSKSSIAFIIPHKMGITLCLQSELKYNHERRIQIQKPTLSGHGHNPETDIFFTTQFLLIQIGAYCTQFSSTRQTTVYVGARGEETRKLETTPDGNQIPLERWVERQLLWRLMRGYLHWKEETSPWQWSSNEHDTTVMDDEASTHHRRIERKLWRLARLNNSTHVLALSTRARFVSIAEWEPPVIEWRHYQVKLYLYTKTRTPRLRISGEGSSTTKPYETENKEQSS